MARTAWQRSVVHVPQSIFLTHDSLARNIAFGSPDQPIDHARVIEAARIAQLDDVIASLPDGLETAVGERGTSLSGGQRQRLGIARAVYKDAPVLLLDEATNALDRETEAALIRALDTLHRLGKTILIISHLESSIGNCDFTVRLEKGKIARSKLRGLIVGSRGAADRCIALGYWHCLCNAAPRLETQAATSNLRRPHRIGPEAIITVHTLTHQKGRQWARHAPLYAPTP